LQKQEITYYQSRLPAGASNLIVVTYRGKKQMGKIIKMPIAELMKRAGIKL
jgi:hexosaminidase